MTPAADQQQKQRRAPQQRVADIEAAASAERTRRSARRCSRAPRRRCRRPSGARAPGRAGRAPGRRRKSSIDWFWQTMQRSSADRARARASSAGSASTSSGWTASAAPCCHSAEQRRAKATKSGRLTPPPRPAWPAALRARRRADAQPAVEQRHRAAAHHHQRAEPDQRHQRLPPDAHHQAAVGRLVAERNIELAEADASRCRLRSSASGAPGRSAWPRRPRRMARRRRRAARTCARSSV